MSFKREIETNKHFSRSWLEIDLAASRHNLSHIIKEAAPCNVLAVLKADGYGLGAAPIARAIVEEGIDRIGVATTEEALKLLPLGVQVQIMSAVFPEELSDIIRARVEVPVTDIAMAREIGRVARKMGITAKGHIKLDTAMGRLGILIEEAEELIPECCNIEGLEIVGIFSHLPCAADHAQSLKQIEQMRKLLDKLAAQNIKFKWRHIANSEAINRVPEAICSPFNLVRAGITQHGLIDAPASVAPWLRPVAAFKSRLISVRTMPAGRTLGYNGTYKLDKPTRIGTIAAGYADGIPLALSNNGEVLVSGRRARIVGRISMDYTTVDLSDIPEAKQGDIVTLFGKDGNDEIPVSDWAKAKATHPYDIICSVSPRVSRIYY